MAPWHWPYRTVFVVGFLVCVILLGYTLYAERYYGLAACSLCILQAAAFAWMAVCFLIGGWHAPSGATRWLYMALVLLGAAIGLAAGSWQLWSAPSGQQWLFLGLPMTAWAIVWYVLLGAFAIHGAVHPFSPRQLERRHATSSDVGHREQG